MKTNGFLLGALALQAFVISLFFLPASEVWAKDVNLKHGWSFSSQLDKMTDKNSSFFSKEGSQGALFFKCYGNGLYEPAWLFGKYLTSKSKFMYRFDKDEPISVRSDQMSTSNKALFLDQEKGFVERAMSASVVVFQARDSDGDVVTQEYELKGLREAINYANKAAPCSR
jgi:hypothetical protein